MQSVPRKVHVRRGSNSYKILKYAAAGAGILVISLVAPQAGAKMIQGLIKGYFRRKSFEKQRFLRDLKNLQTRKLINFRELGGSKVEITLTKAGKQKTLAYELDSLTLKKPERWDGKWRLIFFDIPQASKAARDALREKLRDLNFYQLQKSVHITPYPCEEEVDFIASVFDVRRHIILIPVPDGFEGSEKLRHHFKL